MMNKYSQAGEQQFIMDFFERYTGPHGNIYVDVGAYDGVTNSNTLKLQQLGWGGVCIEPNPTAFADLVKNRQTLNDTWIFLDNTACVGDPTIQKVQFTVFDEIPQFSSISPSPEKTLSEAWALGVLHNPYQIEVNAWTLDDILDYCTPLCPSLRKHGISFLSIDTEGTEMDVLKGFSIHRWYPRLVCIENNDPRNEELDSYMEICGYPVAIRIGVNTLYVRGV